jgi:6-phosphogluconate dehydrogenase
VARIWRAGCIIRAAVLDRISLAYHAQPDLTNLLLDRSLGNEISALQADLRTVVCTSAVMGIPIPALMATLAYFDSYRSAWLPANLIEAQRDYFGAHTYERVDTKGDFHTQWK